MIGLLACAAEEPAIDVFEVVGVSPGDGADDVVEAHVPELRFSALADADTCNADTVRLDGVHEDLTVAFPVEVDVVAIDRGAKIQLDHAAAFPRGWTYAISVAGGRDGCLDVDGNQILAFASTFVVP
ncbi:MAG: hypothetical protein ACOZNI_07430 [Myxococcota bacterium]